MAEQAALSGGAEQELEALSVDDFLNLLELLKIKLPQGVVTPEAVAQSTHSNVIADATLIKQDLENCTLRIAPIPRLACGKIQQVLMLKQNNEFKEITKTIFFRDSEGETLKKRWEKNTQVGCRFRMKNTYQETLTRVRGSGSSFWNNPENQLIAMECFQFYLRQLGLTPNDVECKTNGKLEFGFLSGKPNFLVKMKRSPEDTSPSEKVISKCNSSISQRAGNIFIRPEEGHQAEFHSSHHSYILAQGCLAVIVCKVEQTFYWGNVSEDTDNIEQLNNCKNEALSRFLAVLSLIFEKNN
ncbi:hypothetical protein Q7C36_007151 [Tachysurus vachellii]|uniref:Uncharacterized protein n=1 Tax=Tachysurus vachellii TaxID=175792 RepID=A0AA88NFM7_TACVA|nr:hypothetical protein Q7C36_007151 [Tachysurus vachellii]